MDSFAIAITELWNHIALLIGAHALVIGETARNGYMLALVALFFSVDFISFFPLGKMTEPAHRPRNHPKQQNFAHAASAVG